MISVQALAAQLRADQEFFNRSTRCLTEEHSAFVPAPGMLTVAQQVAHVAQTQEWFCNGMFAPEGFDMNFETHMARVQQVQSLGEARAWLARAFDQFIARVESSALEEISQPLPPGPVLGGLPRLVCISANSDHTAHHRGALTVYSRLLGLTPPMPYADGF